MKKQGLRRRLALCILENLCSHKLTLPNVIRYITPDLLTNYNIRRDQKITAQDIRVALYMISTATHNHSNPIPFRNAPSGSLWSRERRKVFLCAPLTELMRLKERKFLPLTL